MMWWWTSIRCALVAPAADVWAAAGNLPVASPAPIAAAPRVRKFRRLRPSPRKAVADSQQMHCEKNLCRVVLPITVSFRFQLPFAEVSAQLPTFVKRVIARDISHACAGKHFSTPRGQNLLDSGGASLIWG